MPKVDWLTGTYFVAFAAGSVYSVLSWVMTSGDGHGPDGHGGGADCHGHIHAGAGGILAAPFTNMLSLSAMAAVTGGVGYLARLSGAPEVQSLLWALPGGLTAGYGVSGLLAWLHRGTRVLPPTELRGTIATVLARTGPDLVGEVIYSADGRQASLPARTASGQSLEPGSEVVVLEIQDGIALVAPPDEVLAPAREAER